MARTVKVYSFKVLNEPDGEWYEYWFTTRKKAEAGLAQCLEEYKLIPGGTGHLDIYEQTIPLSKAALVEWLNRMTGPL